MASCVLCGAASSGISRELGVCLECIRGRPDEALPHALRAHERSRTALGLPPRPPRSPEGLTCNLCANECAIPAESTGYCGIGRNRGGRLEGASPERGKLSWYCDPLPTNCVGDWVCAGGTGAGWPEYALRPGPELGYKNLAVFFHACSFDCLYCQNWHFKRETMDPRTSSARDLVSAVDERTSCICYFGGDPTPQLPYALEASRLALEENPGRVLRICWETNGSMQPRLLDRMIELSLDSGGCIKFDLKARDENLHIALTGSSNRRTLENFERAAGRTRERAVPPLVVASTLLVPGYIDEDEIRGIAGLIASLDPAIPYSLLAFHPHFYMSDLPLTAKDLARRCLAAAREEGLENVRIGNLSLLAT